MKKQSNKDASDISKNGIAPPWADGLEAFAQSVAETTGRRLLQVRVYADVPRTYHLMTSTGIVEVIEEPKLIK